jgi:sulfate adenylyltransferase
VEDHLVAPHGGRLIDLRAGPERAAELRAESRDWPSWDLTTAQLCALELLVNGGFSPLTGFLGRADYDSVSSSCRLTSGAVWPIPIGLDITLDLAGSLAPGATVALRDPEGTMLAALHVTDIWKTDTGTFRLGGPIEGAAPPSHYDFPSLRLSPAAVRATFARRGWQKAAAYQPGDAMHRAQVEATSAACRQRGARLLIQVPACATDEAHYSRVRSIQAITGEYPEGTVMLSLSPLGRPEAGWRETLLRAIVAKNHGCEMLLIDAEAEQPEFDIGVEVLRLPRDPDEELRRILAKGGEVPEWFTYPDVLAEARHRHPPRDRQGFTVFFTGLSGSGKSTVANVLVAKLMELGGRAVTLLDGDLVRKHLSSELGFSKEHRDINIRRIGFVASEITKNGGIAICAPIAPYRAMREEVRRMIAPVGGFVLVAVSTSLEVCEARDRKGLYAKARAGILKEFTGISDPYEAPADAEIVIDTARLSATEAADEIIGYLEREGFLPPRPPAQ